MKAEADLKALANSIIDSYEIRVKTLSKLINQVNRILISFQRELEEMILRLKHNLAKAESLRKKDFDHMINDIIIHYSRREEETEKSLEIFQKEEEEMISRLRKILLCENSSGLEDIKAIQEDIEKRQNGRERKIIRMLKSFQMEQDELRVAFEKVLSKGNSVKIKDFKMMLKSLKAQQNDCLGDLNKIMEEFEFVRDEVQAQWQGVSSIQL